MSSFLDYSGSSRCIPINLHHLPSQSCLDQVSLSFFPEQQKLSSRLSKRYSTRSTSVMDESLVKSITLQTTRTHSNISQQPLNSIQNNDNSAKNDSKQMYSSNPHHQTLSTFSTNESQKVNSNASPDEKYFEVQINEEELFSDENDIQDEQVVTQTIPKQQQLQHQFQTLYQQNPIELVKSSHQKLQSDMYQDQLFSNKVNCVPHYAYSVIQTLHILQKEVQISEIREKVELSARENLMDKMCLMHSELKLSNETFFLAGNIMSRYLEGQVVSMISQTRLIVLMATCLFISAKYEEIYPPSLRIFVSILEEFLQPVSPSTSLNKLILDQEGIILTQLGFGLFFPTRFQFFEAFIQLTSLDTAQKCFCSYLLELSQLNHSFYKYSHSEIAAAVILLSEKFKNISGRYFWSSDLEIITNFKQQDLYNCVEELYQYLLTISQQKKSFYLYQKYSQIKYKSVALIDYDLTNNINNQQYVKQSSQIIDSQYMQNISDHSQQEEMFVLSEINQLDTETNNYTQLLDESSYAIPQLDNINSNYTSKMNIDICSNHQIQDLSSLPLRDYQMISHLQENSIIKDFSNFSHKNYSSTANNLKDNNNYPLKNISNKIHHPKFSMNSSEHIQKKKKGHSKYSISNLANLNKENNPLSHSRHSSQTSYDINHKKYGIKK